MGPSNASVAAVAVVVAAVAATVAGNSFLQRPVDSASGSGTSDCPCCPEGSSFCKAAVAAAVVAVAVTAAAVQPVD